jgi:hypothetical protein
MQKEWHTATKPLFLGVNQANPPNNKFISRTEASVSIVLS